MLKDYFSTEKIGSSTSFGDFCRKLLLEMSRQKDLFSALECARDNQDELVDLFVDNFPGRNVCKSDTETYPIYFQTEPELLQLNFPLSRRFTGPIVDVDGCGDCVSISPDSETFAQLVNCLEAWQRWDAERVAVRLIPPERRTKPITKIKAARALGRDGDKSAAVEFVTKCIDDGIIAAQKMNRQSWVFDISDFPESSHNELKPSKGS